MTRPWGTSGADKLRDAIARIADAAETATPLHSTLLQTQAGEVQKHGYHHPAIRTARQIQQNRRRAQQRRRELPPHRRRRTSSKAPALMTPTKLEPTDYPSRSIRKGLR